MRPCIQATILFSLSCATAVSISSSGGQQIAEPQLAVFQHLLDLSRRCKLGPQQRVSRAARAVSRHIDPCQASTPRRSPCRRCPPPAARTRCRIVRSDSSADTSRAFNPSPPARQRFPPFAGHADDGLFHGLLHARGQVRPHAVRESPRPIGAARCARRSARRNRRGSAARLEERAVQTRANRRRRTAEFRRNRSR